MGLWACDGAIVGGGRVESVAVEPPVPTTPEPEPSPTPAACHPPASLRVPLQRLDALRLQAAIAEAFGVRVSLDRIPRSSASAPFSTFWNANIIGVSEVELLADLADEVAEASTRNATCAGAQPTCARTFLEALALRAYRRPPTLAEVDALVGAYTVARTTLPYDEALGVAVSAVMQSPAFLYLVESQATGTEADLSPAMLAQRLAFVLTDAPPDAALRMAQASLTTSSGLEAEARRLLRTPGARATAHRFFREWLEAPAGQSTPHAAPLRAALEEEFTRLVDRALDSADPLAELLTSDVAFVNPTLAAFYGVSAPSEDRFVEVRLGPSRRVGLLSHPLVLASKSHGDDSSVILRGKFLRTRLLCGALPVPPAGVQALDPVLPAGATAREKSAARSRLPACGGCHSLMDPLGFGLEAFDGLGRYREGADTAVVVVASAKSDGAYASARALMEAVTANGTASDCLASQYLAYVYGKKLTAESACAAETLATSWRSTGPGFDALRLGATLQPLFGRRTLTSEPTP